MEKNEYTVGGQIIILKQKGLRVCKFKRWNKIDVSFLML